MARTVALAPLLLLLAACPDEDAGEARRLPPERTFHEHVLAVVDGYPTDGTHGYHWPRPDKGGWLGNTRKLEYAGEVLSEGDALQRLHFLAQEETPARAIISLEAKIGPDFLGGGVDGG